ncbi:SMP-30/gluconolactonase/LRE family protein [Beijerinckia indica]|uniref:SMP-30/Gluconolaconase/LRE domain protein n=1 Tax=Beijerinckia indica subsp. indica (strain ATCC 9039 / DSM 1715 / NCIMB 8712) TaxID=395963 RepID=B2IBL0_BEII9|nr:SMP-30/gluconolactonase/LRE family protein [Beijerinckia indica]ACB96636.1 SMP-30/Gluconolaconase/LRE domain protein [Beijerinckia indica subsp. indica ATCC 9039]
MTAIDGCSDMGKGRSIEQVAATLLCAERCHLGEGPAYDEASDTAWWFDIVERRLFEARLGDSEIFIHPLPFMASALAHVDDRRQLMAAEDGLYLRTKDSGVLQQLVAIEPDNPITRSNDSRAHPSGTFWTSTMGRKAEVGAGSIYALHRGALQRLFTGLTIPNAICFSPDGTMGYFADTYENVLYRVPLDLATGLPSGGPSALHRRETPGWLDGAVTDADGLIWCACWGGACVEAFSPDGAHLRTVAAPALNTSCPVFVGPGYTRLLVTSAYQDMDISARAADPHHGCTFLLDIGAKGRPEPRVKLAADP